MGSSLSTNKFPVQGRTVLLTGASRGTGLEAARQLAAKGANVMMVARDAERLRDGVNSPKTAALSSETQRFQFIPADLTDAEACAQVMSQEVQVYVAANPSCHQQAHDGPRRLKRLRP
ncbi:hypothetical protein FJTKL_00512 [Diaporthe vaccinii]|uniref:Uncharacterized protein n=1 Tax=Diaporthe vaccinii TaxID=105482 RepID=A0ABR4E2R7_9PEZI